MQAIVPLRSEVANEHGARGKESQLQAVLDAYVIPHFFITMAL